MSAVRKAIDLFRRFRGRKPRPDELGTIEIEGQTVFLLGEMPEIRYCLAGEKKCYYHPFHKSCRPLLYVNFDGSQVFIVKGRWRFTERGFVDDKPARAKRGAS